MFAPKQIKEKSKAVLSSPLVKISSLTSISTFIKIGATFVSAKVLAVLTGPAGVAMLGQLTNFMTILIQVCSGATGTGIVKLTGQYKDQPEYLKKVYSTSFSIILFFSLLSLLLILFFQDALTIFIFKTPKYKWLIYLIAISTPLIAINNFIVSVLSGLYEFKKYVKIQSISSILSVILTVTLVYFYNVQGALLAYVLAQVLLFFVSLYYSKIIEWKEQVMFHVDIAILKKIGHFALYVIISAFCFPFVQILVRNLLIENLGLEIAGIWEGTNRLSSMYLLLISTTIGVYFFPKISGISENKEVVKEVNFALKIFVSATLIAGSLLLVVKDFIIPIVLSNRFLAINEILHIQIFGDVFLIVKMLFSMVLLSRDKTMLMILFEFLSSLLYFLMNYYLISFSNELNVIIWAYPFYTFIYCLFLYLTYKKNIYVIEDKSYNS